MKKNKNNNNYCYEDFTSFDTRQFSTLTTISGHLKGIVSHKITQYQKLYVYFNLYVYISRDFSLPLAIEMYGWPLFVSGPSLLSYSLILELSLYNFFKASKTNFL